MPGLFSRIRGKDGQGKTKSKKGANADDLTHQLPQKPQWEDAYTRTSVDPEEVGELIHACTEELKARALDLPFLLLPFRPTSDPSAVRNFIRHFFDGAQPARGDYLVQELRMTEPMVISGVLKWCWSRLQGGVVGWDAYELFKVGEQDSNMARDSFRTFIPLSVDNEVRTSIIFDYFDLLSAVAAHGKMNGFGGRKLSRMASWWAFEHKDTGNGFEGGYRSWLTAADATSHMFFAYLRSLAPQPTLGGISMLPMSLQKLLQETEYPPQKPSLMQSTTNRVVMIVDSVSPTPFALLRRANHFQYRENDRALHQFSEYDDPVKALTEECRRVLKAISLANQKSQVSSAKHSTGLRDASWSRFEDIGFGGAVEEEEDDEAARTQSQPRNVRGLRTTPASGTADLGRPTTPSWADFLSSGFVDDSPNSPSMLLPPDKVLPPIDTTVRQKSSQSHNPRLESNQFLEPGELANITRFDLDDAFWWVWMSSLAPEETPERKSAFGRCAVIETIIRSGRWLVMEEMVKGAAPEPEAGAYVAEKKGLFSWTRRNKDKGISRSKSVAGKRALEQQGQLNPNGGLSKTSIGPDQQAKIQAAAQQLQAKQYHEMQNQSLPMRRGRTDTELMREKTTSILTLQPAVMKEASPAMKWANKYDKDAIREAYLSSTNLGRGLEEATMQTNGHSENNSMTNGSARPNVPAKSPTMSPQPSPGLVPPQASGQHEQANGSRNRTPEPPRDFETEAHQNVHPLQRAEATGRDSPLPPPPRDFASMEAARSNMVSPEAVKEGKESKESKKQQKKLHKEKDEKKSGGFRKLFGRSKNRGSKVPDNAASDVNKMIAETPAAAPEKQPEPVPSEPAEVSAHDFPLEPIEEATPTPTQAEHHGHEPAYEPSVDENISRVDTADAAEANQAFQRFDQGPLSDQPAFVPEVDGSDDEAAPPPIGRHAGNQRRREEVEEEQEEAAPAPGVPVQDRWAQIRKNAADRARHSEEQSSRGGYSKATTEGDDETSGEETIESRVARIKARVAELTGNMENTTTAPGTRTPPSRR
ncbi:morphogenesis-related protein MSB1 [Apiospora phragmitis]|uniref:Morphogenesis-related protein MSB1 n=1 Tax=Apiospora phragmitis TaxID=2905665 RepID=A0ABR1V0U2_9PEZI